MEEQFSENRNHSINDPLYDEWQQYRTQIMETNEYPVSFSEWKINLFNGGIFLYYLDCDRINKGEVQRQGAYWYELDKSKNILRHGGPFETLLDAASDVGKSDYYLYQGLDNHPTTSPFELQPDYHRAWSNGFEFEMTLRQHDYEEIDIPVKLGYYWCINGNNKEICHVDTQHSPPEIKFIEGKSVDIKGCHWSGPII